MPNAIVNRTKTHLPAVDMGVSSVPEMDRCEEKSGRRELLFIAGGATHALLLLPKSYKIPFMLSSYQVT
jgi:hypothetical protein